MHKNRNNKCVECIYSHYQSARPAPWGIGCFDPIGARAAPPGFEADRRAVADRPNRDSLMSKMTSPVINKWKLALNIWIEK